jgi:GNAT superfamily N-acetyltransferase
MVLSVFQKNIPQFFAPAEKDDLIQYLKNEKEDYFLMEADDQLLGCGGINYFPNENTARVAWDFFDPVHQGRGYGRHLLEFRINYIRKHNAFDKIQVRTSQLAYLFYEKAGFKLNYVKGNYWAEGLHLYFMELILSD